MDDQSKAAVRVLEAIGAATEQLILLAVAMRRRPGARLVATDLDIRGLTSGTVLSGEVDVELDGGQGLCWWLEVQWDETGWVIQTRVLLQRLDGVQDVLRELPERRATGLDEFIAELEGAVAALIASAEAVDLAEFGAETAVSAGVG